ncbi:uncharacterized protein P174DRAFT_434252 [Aspergillus novofumigatus IBT 16806]|uniref:Uncharacterized protein n=1 Tax=Aspergillus novofumigatus (strain IBT 16806) TaxID=1392255 RepID=A0A2I1C0M8_ASPN1|nr:uncharacterized protein P174DRAFT_434252 [Aspergillus novofumigatus IBT 16806]PKX91196.1 hypothetical protein P174DRAFT_434252 [Aspergillus novofumigatus IBT 16806]
MPAFDAASNLMKASWLLLLIATRGTAVGPAMREIERVIGTPSMRANAYGTDLTKCKLIEVSDLVKVKKLFTVFDGSYQGFAIGDFRQMSGPSGTLLSRYSPSDSKLRVDIGALHGKLESMGPAVIGLLLPD